MLPDKNKKAQSSEDEFKNASEAYSVLADEEQRRIYDRTLGVRKVNSSSTRWVSSTRTLLLLSHGGKERTKRTNERTNERVGPRRFLLMPKRFKCVLPSLSARQLEAVPAAPAAPASPAPAPARDRTLPQTSLAILFVSPLASVTLPISIYFGGLFASPPLFFFCILHFERCFGFVCGCTSSHLSLFLQCFSCHSLRSCCPPFYDDADGRMQRKRQGRSSRCTRLNRRPG